MAVASPLLELSQMDADRDRVEAAMLHAVRTRDAYLTQIASHLIVAGGKRLRPVMTIAAAKVGSSEPVSDNVILGGISCELVHLGSLYHDDVMDEGVTRRGVETVNAKWGNLQAILAGDFLLARASEIAAGLGNDIAGLLARTIGQLCEGQIEELRFTYNVSRAIPSYLLSIEGKTASLYSTAARIGGLVAGHDAGVVDALTNYGTSFGMLFQIIDDILDLTATDEELGKPSGHDMEEGVYTLPVMLHLLMVAILQTNCATCWANLFRKPNDFVHSKLFVQAMVCSGQLKQQKVTCNLPKQNAIACHRARQPMRCVQRQACCLVL
jgi:heptaprenyl diphosphate synthase